MNILVLGQKGEFWCNYSNWKSRNLADVSKRWPCARLPDMVKAIRHKWPSVILNTGSTLTNVRGFFGQRKNPKYVCGRRDIRCHLHGRRSALTSAIKQQQQAPVQPVAESDGCIVIIHTPHNLNQAPNHPTNWAKSSSLHVPGTISSKNWTRLNYPISNNWTDTI